MRSVLLPLSLGAFATILGACSLAQDDVDALLARGQAGEALRRLAQDDGALPHESPPERARHGLRRGLAHLSLGDRVAARGWLLHARDIVDQDPLALSSLDRARLLDALRSLDAP